MHDRPMTSLCATSTDQQSARATPTNSNLHMYGMSRNVAGLCDVLVASQIVDYGDRPELSMGSYLNMVPLFLQRLP